MAKQKSRSRCTCLITYEYFLSGMKGNRPEFDLWLSPDLMGDTVRIQETGFLWIRSWW